MCFRGLVSTILKGSRTLHFVIRAERLGRSRDVYLVLHQVTVVVAQSLLNLRVVAVLPKL